MDVLSSPTIFFYVVASKLTGFIKNTNILSTNSSNFKCHYLLKVTTSCIYFLQHKSDILAFLLGET